MDSFLFTPVTRLFIVTSRSDPFICFRLLKFLQLSDAMRGKHVEFSPTINGVSEHTYMQCELIL